MSNNVAPGSPGDDWHPHVFRMPDWVEPVVCVLDLACVFLSRVTQKPIVEC